MLPATGCSVSFKYVVRNKELHSDLTERRIKGIKGVLERDKNCKSTPFDPKKASPTSGELSFAHLSLAHQRHFSEVPPRPWRGEETRDAFWRPILSNVSLRAQDACDCPGVPGQLANPGERGAGPGHQGIEGNSASDEQELEFGRRPRDSGRAERRCERRPEMAEGGRDEERGRRSRRRTLPPAAQVP